MSLSLKKNHSLLVMKLLPVHVEKCSVLFQAQLMDLHTLSIEEVCVSANCSDELFCLTSVLFKCTV